MSKPKNPLAPRKHRPHLVLSIDMDPAVIARYEEKVAKLGITKREYIERLVLKDLGLVFIPGRYVEEKDVQATL